MKQHDFFGPNCSQVLVIFITCGERSVKHKRLRQDVVCLGSDESGFAVKRALTAAAVVFIASLFSPSCQGLSKALLELRAEMTATAEQQVIASAARKEETLNVQMLVDRHTKDLKVPEGSTSATLLTDRITV